MVKTLAHHKKSPARQATSKRQLMASTARCGPLDPLPRQGEAGRRFKVDPHRQYNEAEDDQASGLMHIYRVNRARRA